MKLVLLSDVKGLGKKGDLVKASDGYSRNFLIPKNLAKEANAQALNELKNAKAAQQHKIDIEKQQAQDNFDKINEKTIKIIAKAGQNGHLFGSVTNKDIASRIESEFSIKTDKRKISIENGDIKQFGTYNCQVKLYQDIVAKVFVMVGEK